MPKVSLIGVGDVGATAAHLLQVSGTATELVLVDADQARAAGHALDLNHGLFFAPPVTIRAGDLGDCAGSDLIVITAGARQQPGETRLDLTRRNAGILRSIMTGLRPHVGDARVLIVTNPVDVMTRVAADCADLPPGRLFGSGTVLDSARFRFELSRWCGVDARNVHAYVLGEHGDSEVFCWSHASIGAIPLRAWCRGCRRDCDQEQRAAIEQRVRDSAYHVIEAKGFTNFGVAMAIRRIAEATLRDEQSLLTLSTALDGEYGLHGVCLSLPCLVGRDGVTRTIPADLSADEEQALRRSAAVLEQVYAQLGAA